MKSDLEPEANTGINTGGELIAIIRQLSGPISIVIKVEKAVEVETATEAIVETDTGCNSMCQNDS